MITEKTADRGNGPGISKNMPVRSSPGYFKVRCPTCAAMKGARCRNRNGVAIEMVHFLRARLAAEKGVLSR